MSVLTDYALRDCMSIYMSPITKAHVTMCIGAALTIPTLCEKDMEDVLLACVLHEIGLLFKRPQGCQEGYDAIVANNDLLQLMNGDELRLHNIADACYLHDVPIQETDSRLRKIIRYAHEIAVARDFVNLARISIRDHIMTAPMTTHAKVFNTTNVPEAVWQTLCKKHCVNGVNGDASRRFWYIPEDERMFDEEYTRNCSIICSYTCLQVIQSIYDERWLHDTIETAENESTLEEYAEGYYPQEEEYNGQKAIWKAIDAYVVSCGGDITYRTVRGPRKRAKRKVDEVIVNMLTK